MLACSLAFLFACSVASLLARLPTCILARLPSTCLLTCLFTLLARPPACLLTCSLAYLLGCSSTCLFVCFLARVFARLTSLLLFARLARSISCLMYVFSWRIIYALRVCRRVREVESANTTDWHRWVDSTKRRGKNTPRDTCAASRLNGLVDV